MRSDAREEKFAKKEKKKQGHGLAGRWRTRSVMGLNIYRYQYDSM